jgi:2-phosphosulfolactate phosphatase
MKVVIDCYFDELPQYRNGYTIVAVDVIRATTTAITGVSLGRKCYPVASIEEATALAQTLDDPLLVGELGGNMPYDFHLQNSPTELESQTDLHRPMILLTTSGRPWICSFKDSADTYIACLRNYRSMTSHMIDRHSDIALIGAGSRGEFREEDQLCCAWIAKGLIQKGYQPENEETSKIIERWSKAPAESILAGKSAIYLSKSGQNEDLDYIVSHVDDLNSIYYLKNDQIVEKKLSAEMKKVI